MKRYLYKELVRWKNNKNRKPLILNGARQVGKTWLLKEFGNKEYQNVAYVNCDNNPMISQLFSDFDTNRIIRTLSAITNENILPEETLIILDEIQEAPLGLTALKYFCEDASLYHIAVAGSLLGIQMHSGSGYPVGKVDELTLYPMTFGEFMLAYEKEGMWNILHNGNMKELTPLKNMFIDLLKQYYYVGGMPGVVLRYVQNGDLFETRRIQKSILDDYRRDFAKHIPANLLVKVNMVWDSVPAQMAKENKKFIYGFIKKGGRAKEFEDAIQWLIDAGLIHKVNRIKKISKPLKFYEDFGAFKLFLNDLGLMGAMSDVSAKDVLVDNHIFEEYKGAFTEQYVAQQLISNRWKLYYYSNEKSTLEIDFLIQGDRIYPIEVKATENLRAKSLKTIIDSHDHLSGTRFSMADYREQDWMTNVPLYAIEKWMENID